MGAPAPTSMNLMSGAAGATRPPLPPSTTGLRESEAYWRHLENVRCIAQILECGRIPLDEAMAR